MKLEFDYPEEFAEMAKNFHNSYNIKKLIYSLQNNPVKLKLKNERVCRYCGKSMPDVSFKKKAHLIPEFLGRNNLVCDYECDICNNAFSVYEDSFANYLGIERSIRNIKGKEGVPKYKSKDINLGKIQFLNHDNAFSIEPMIGSHLASFIKETGELTFEYTKNPYRPLCIYKFLLKLGLSIMDEDEIAQYSSAISLISNPLLKIQNDSVCRLFGFHLNVTYPVPIVLLLEKVSDDLAVPTHTIILFIKNTMYQIYLWGKDSDFSTLKESIVTIPIAPPLFLNAGDNLVAVDSINCDLANYDLSKNQTGFVKFIIAKEEMEKHKLFDPITKAFSEIPDEDIIKQIIFVHMDQGPSQDE